MHPLLVDPNPRKVFLHLKFEGFEPRPMERTVWQLPSMWLWPVGLARDRAAAIRVSTSFESLILRSNAVDLIERSCRSLTCERDSPTDKPQGPGVAKTQTARVLHLPKLQ